MKHRTSIFFSVLVGLALTGIAAAAQDAAAGRWELTVASPQGANVVTLDLTGTRFPPDGCKLPEWH